MGEEADEWIKLGGLLLDQLATVKDKNKETQPSGEIEVTVVTVEEKNAKTTAEAKEKSTEESEEGEGVDRELPEMLSDEISVIGVDGNLCSKSLQQAVEEVKLKVEDTE